MRRLLTAIISCLLVGQAARAQQTLTYPQLVGRLTDLERLAELPASGERCMQHASWDRRAKYDEKTGKYVHWHANGDGNGYIRKEGESLVIAEMAGPGCIWRIWSAKTDAGHVKIYLDGADKPAVDIPFKAYFDHTARPFVYPTLCYDSARGKNSYVPIPFAKSCKIVAEKGWGRYYHFTYSLFPEGTQVPTFRLPPAPGDEAALKKTDTFFAQRFGTDPAGRRDGQKTEKRTLTVAAGRAETVCSLAGPRAITALKVRMDLADRDDEMDALRQLVLRITWDRADAPAVWCPLGDFFGTAPGVNKYKSLPLGMTDEGFYSFWYMPFATAAKVELVNDGEEAREVELAVTHAPLTRPVEQLGRFHAKWHRDAFQPTKDRWPDWTMLKTTGRGRFCGVMLHVWNPKGGQCPAAGEGRYWWGEGDEKFFVDGEKFPSTFGTGSEDYFGYAWGNPQLFARAFHNQTISMGNKGHISVNRWQIGDNVPFSKSFEGAIEKYFSNDWPTRYAAVAYWYLSAGGEDPYGPVPVNDRLNYYEKPKVYRIKGAIEGEAMKVLAKTAGDPKRQDMANFRLGKWSELGQLWWTGAKPGDKLTLALPVRRAGRFELTAVMTKAIDYGIVKLLLDGKAVGDQIDLYNDGVIPTKPISLGTHELTKGEHKLVVEIVGANDRAQKAYMFGLDYVLLKPAE